MGAVALRMTLAAASAAMLALGMGACGGDDEPAQQSTSGSQGGEGTADLAAIKTFLLDHTERLSAEVSELREGAERYYALAKENDFDYERLLTEHRAEVRELVEQGQSQFAKANPAYEQMEGVVAGVPSLADYDVSIDAGGDASDPASAVPFSVRTPDGKTYKQPGNYNYLVETSLFGTEPKFAAKGVEPDLDGDGRTSSSARRSRTRTSTWPPRATSRRR